MSTSLSIECEWIDQPAACDPLERRTWADLRIRARGRAVTRVWDRQSQAERTSLFVPVWPLARWIVQNWWPLLFETCRSDEVPPAERSPTPCQRDWLRRHCLRSAESGLLLPRVCFYSDGDQACVDWASDAPQAYPHMPGEFIESGRVWLPHEGVSDALRGFVRTVLERVTESTDARVLRLAEDWRAITHADVEETTFCRSAGRLGLDPYALHQWDPGIVDFVESGLGDGAEQPLATDFLEATADPVHAPDVWRWIQSTRLKFDLRAAPHSPAPFGSEGENPATAGYRTAANLRRRIGCPGGVLSDLSEAAKTAGIPPLRYEWENHLSGSSVRALVGWQGGQRPLIAGPAPARDDSRRFLEARALFLVAHHCQESPRLTTSAHTWSQKAARAFAAELLAPQSDVVGRWTVNEASGGDVDERIRSLAQYYQVSTKVIELQLENAKVNLLDE